jgi:hypothetical protein
MRPHISSGWKKCNRTYNSGHELLVTYLTSDSPVSCLNKIDQTTELVVCRTLTKIPLKITVCRNFALETDCRNHIKCGICEDELPHLRLSYSVVALTVPCLCYTLIVGVGVTDRCSRRQFS